MEGHLFLVQYPKLGGSQGRRHLGFFFKSSPEDMLIDLRERGSQGGREINVRERQQLGASRTRPDQRWNPQPRYVP